MLKGTIDTGMTGGFWLVSTENPPSADGRWITSHGWTTQIDRIAELTLLRAEDAFNDGSGPSDDALYTARQLLMLFAAQFPAPSELMLPYDLYAAPGNGIQLDWRFALSDLEVCIDCDGIISYCRVQSTGIQHAANTDQMQVVRLVAKSSSSPLAGRTVRKAVKKTARASRASGRKSRTTAHAVA